jgi:hypothetical protein
MGGELDFPKTLVRVSFIHEGGLDHPVDLLDESSGTRKLFTLGPSWYLLATEPVTLFVDELGASLHPRLLDRLVRSVNDAPEARAQSQLIFATHDTGLLESQDGLLPALRSDQVYLTKKDVFGGTELYSVAEFEDDLGAATSMRKRYLSGLYGALPSVGKLSL